MQIKSNIEGWRQFGCPTCGNIRLLPAGANETPPWCIHHDGNYSWRANHPELMTPPWTRMVPVKVESV